ncbi:CocE/NonD family hydrolase [Mycolicibacterium aichiense]|uniref:CocE/NonD family hydrolase n=1 Tax=Mycolicibacterium aichiense TaxID=1799 RepID=UPI003D675A70
MPAITRSADGLGHPTGAAVVSLVTSLATAGRDVEPSAATTLTGSGAAVSAAAPADPPFPIPLGADVKVVQVHPPLMFLQQLPVVGRLIVTPVVSALHAVPLVGDLVHTFVGFPIDHSAPPGAPQPATYRVTSFDGTSIYVNVMPAVGLQAGQTAPTVLDGPGLGLPGSTALNLTTDELLPNDVIGIGALRKAGYNVVTWDPRGEWRSGGVLHIDSPQLEGRDVSSIISFLSTLPEVQLDTDNDPRIGMVGASYGGGIQLSAAGIDPRIDAIVPTIAWNNLVDVLFPHGAVNTTWGTLLPSVLALTLSRSYPRIYPVAIMGVLFGIAHQQDIDLVNSFGFRDNLKDITAPTLLIQGTVDTLFPLAQATLNYHELTSAESVKVIWYCGGHGACLSSNNTGQVNITRTLGWLDYYVKGDENADTGPTFEYVDQNGHFWASDAFPIRTDDTPLTAVRTTPQTLPYIPFVGGTGPDPRILLNGPLQALLGLGASGPALNAVNLQVAPVTEDTQIVGAPLISFTYSGTGNARHVYAQIVDDTTNQVLGTISTPIPVTLDGQTRTVTDFAMSEIAQTLAPGQSVHVQLVTSAIEYLNFYSYGDITIDSMSISLPTVASGAARPVTATT